MVQSEEKSDIKKIYCACGCGQEIIIKPHHKYTGIPKFKQNHCLLPTKETRKKNSEVNKIVMHIPEIREKSSKGWFKKGHKGYNVEKQKTGFYKSCEICGSLFYVPKCLSHRKTCGNKDCAREINRRAQKGRKLSEETKRKIRETVLEQWSDDVYKEKRLKKFFKYKKPNFCEQNLSNLLQQTVPDEYRYNDGQFILGGKIPDFPNVNGQKKLIELYGDYWHRNDNPQDRIDYLKQFGYDTLIIWERELKDKEVLINKILEFHKR